MDKGNAGFAGSTLGQSETVAGEVPGLCGAGLIVFAPRFTCQQKVNGFVV